MNGKITIDAERCKGCGLCVAVCPKGCISISSISNKAGYSPAESSNRDCTGCRMCALMCAETAIEVYRGSRIVDIKEKTKAKDLTREKL